MKSMFLLLSPLTKKAFASWDLDNMTTFFRQNGKNISVGGSEQQRDPLFKIHLRET